MNIKVNNEYVISVKTLEQDFDVIMNRFEKEHDLEIIVCDDEELTHPSVKIISYDKYKGMKDFLDNRVGV